MTEAWQAATFSGLDLVTDPRDLSPGAALILDNWQVWPGQMKLRGGLKRYALEEATDSSDHLGVFYVRLPHKAYIVHHTAYGNVWLGNASGANKQLETGVATKYPSHWCLTRDCRVIRVNGVQRGSIFDGGVAVPLGVPKPTSAPTITLAGSGNSQQGDYTCAYRYLDAYENPSSLSPLQVVTTSSTGRTFLWSFPAGSDARHHYVELYRSTVNQATTLYRVARLSASETHYWDKWSDETMMAYAQALPIRNPDGTPNANRFDPPPENCSVCVQYLDRYFYLVQPVMSLEEYSGISNWTTSIIGRYIYREGSRPERVIGATSTTLTLEYSGVQQKSDLIAANAYVGPSPEERNAIFFSEPDEPESVPGDYNMLVIQNNTGDDDWITGAHVVGAEMYITKERHTYVLTYARQPVIDASVHLLVARGAVNQRCVAILGSALFLLDKLGAWMLHGDEPDHIGAPLQPIWNEQIDWSKSRWFFASADPITHIVRFHVSFIGDSAPYPTRAVCYSLLTKSWWTESYPVPLCGATLLADQSEVVCGSRWAGLVVLDRQKADLASEFYTGTVTDVNNSTYPYYLEDANASFGQDVPLSWVAITRGRALGQYRQITSRTAKRLYYGSPWPDLAVGDRYVVGAIPAVYRTGMVPLNAPTSTVHLAHKPGGGPIHMSYLADGVPARISVSRVDAGIELVRDKDVCILSQRSSNGFIAIPLSVSGPAGIHSPKWLQCEMTAFNDQAIYQMAIA